LRRTLTASGTPAPDRERAAAALAALAAEGVAGAHPEHWRGLAEASTRAPLVDLDDPEARIRVSPSKITEVERSALEWFVAQMAGGDVSVSQGFGTLVHDVLEHAVGYDIDTLWAALQARWGELSFASQWLGDQQLRRARRAIEALAEYLADEDRAGIQLVSAEQAFELDLPPAVLTGKIDRIESHDGAIMIVDLKTGRVEPAGDVAGHPQLGAYQLAYADEAIEGLPDGHRPGGARLLFTREGTKGKRYTLRDQPAFTAEQLDEFRGRIREASARMIGPDFPAVVIDDPFVYGDDIRRVHLPDEVSSD
jgi:RecB family exonuclease